MVGHCSVLPNTPANFFATSNGSRQDHQLAGPTVDFFEGLAELAATTLRLVGASGHDPFRNDSIEINRLKNHIRTGVEVVPCSGEYSEQCLRLRQMKHHRAIRCSFRLQIRWLRRVRRMKESNGDELVAVGCSTSAIQKSDSDLSCIGRVAILSGTTDRNTQCQTQRQCPAHSIECTPVDEIRRFHSSSS